MNGTSPSQLLWLVAQRTQTFLIKKNTDTVFYSLIYKKKKKFPYECVKKRKIVGFFYK